MVMSCSTHLSLRSERICCFIHVVVVAATADAAVVATAAFH